MELDRIYTGDCRRLIESAPDNFFALSLWSPPYFVGKEYEVEVTFEEWREMLREVISSHYRVLKPGGFLAINIADIKCFADENMPRFATNNISGKKHPVTREMVLDMKERHPRASRGVIAEKLGCSEQTVDRRLHGTNIRGGKYQPQTRVRLSGPDIESFAYDSGLYLYDNRIWKKDPAWANSRWTTGTLRSIDEWEDIYIFWKPGETIVDKSKLSRSEWSEWGSRSVWEIPSVRRNDDHPAKFPLELASRLIRIYSDKGDTILDPFMGSGTSAISAVSNGRRYVGFELHEKYAVLARNNIRRHLINEVA